MGAAKIENNIKSTFNGILINALSIGNKYQELDILMTKEPASSEIVAITETWLHPDDDNARFLCKNTHNIFRRDRADGEHGGVALLVNKLYKCSQVHFKEIIELEYACCRIITHTILYLYCCPLQTIVYEACASHWRCRKTCCIP